MNKRLLGLLVLFASGCASNTAQWPLAAWSPATNPEQWLENGRVQAERLAAGWPQARRAKNVILFIGDGMGVSTVTAARIFEGQLAGRSGEENFLSFERFPYTALIKTYEVDQQVPDSAGTMTAMMTGVKTNAGLIGLDQTARRGDCASARVAIRRTLLEEAEQEGLATGIVTTTRLTHATPAATYAHVPDRDWESDADLPQAAKEAGCRDIARQLIEFPYGDGPEVALGGGRQKFLPNQVHDPEYPNQSGSRQDGRNLLQEWQLRPNSAYVWNKEQFDAVDPAKIDRLLGLFEPSHLKYERDRLLDQGTEPSLSEMTAKAIQILKKSPKGFFLMVEGGRIDHAHHAGNAYRALTETIELAHAVEVAMQLTDPRETLIVVTADHSQPLVLAGYPKRGNPILGKVRDGRGEIAKAADGLPYTALSYANGRGAHLLPEGGDAVFAEKIHAGRFDLRQVDPTHPGYHQEALVPLEASTHAGEDVPLYAAGANAHLFRGVLEQHVICHLLRQAAGF
ncbi:MAG: alkaline phosphatase [Methylohalobius sp.]|nr:alkaline phosphatase [Methylohalobius sp.]